jgi:hypothetical protein
VFGKTERQRLVEACACARYVPSDPTLVNSIEDGVDAGHERHPAQIQTRRDEPLDDIRRPRALDRQQLHVIAEVLHAHVAVKQLHLLVKVLHVPDFGGPVHDHVHVVSGVGNDGVVNDPAVLVGNERKEAVVRRQSGNVPDHEPFQKRDAVLPVPPDLNDTRDEPLREG